MGYHFDITRELNQDNQEISREEWEKCARDSGDFEYIGESDSWVWSQDGKSCLWYSEEGGTVWAKNPSEEFIRFLVELAPRLNALVRGGSGEYWRSMDEVFFVEAGKEIPWDVKEKERVTKVKIKRRRIVYKRVGIILLGIIIGTLIAMVKNA